MRNLDGGPRRLRPDLRCMQPRAPQRELAGHGRDVRVRPQRPRHDSTALTTTPRPTAGPHQLRRQPRRSRPRCCSRRRPATHPAEGPARGRAPRETSTSTRPTSPHSQAEGYRYPWEGLQGIFAERRPVDRQPRVRRIRAGVGAEPSSSRSAATPMPSGRCGPPGVEVANLGNNHSGDYGPEAMVDSRSQLRGGLDRSGRGWRRRRRSARAGHLRDQRMDGCRRRLRWGRARPRSGSPPTTDPAWPTATRSRRWSPPSKRRTRSADLVFVTIHWGVELDTTPRPEDRERAEAMIAAGADAIFGHHAHRLQPLEIVDGVPGRMGPRQLRVADAVRRRARPRRSPRSSSSRTARCGRASSRPSSKSRDIRCCRSTTTRRIRAARIETAQITRPTRW